MTSWDRRVLDGLAVTMTGAVLSGVPVFGVSMIVLALAFGVTGEARCAGGFERMGETFFAGEVSCDVCQFLT